ncbi:hypothetical protein DW240_20450, partial [Phocaeicola vulgatus]
NLLKDSKSININIDGSCFSVHHIYITYGAPACTTCLFILNLSKNSHLCLFPFFRKCFAKIKRLFQTTKKLSNFFKTFLFHLCSSNHLVSFKLTSLAKRMQK